jgi:hypothetical protein
MDRFQFKGEFPAEVRPVVEAIILRYDYLLPSWCHHVVVFWKADERDGDIAWCSSKYEYKFASITICPLWLDGDAEERERAIEHELNHIPTMPLADWIRGAITRLVPKECKPELQAELLESLRIWNESVTSELVDIMRRGAITPPVTI